MHHTEEVNIKSAPLNAELLGHVQHLAGDQILIGLRGSWKTMNRLMQIIFVIKMQHDHDYGWITEVTCEFT